MMRIFPITSTSDSSTVTATVAGLGGAMAADETHMLVSSTACWVKQGTCRLVTCATNANMTDGDYISITYDGETVVYEYDKSANGVTAGRETWAAGASTAAHVAATLKTAIDAAQAPLDVTDNLDGTLTISANARLMVITENVAHASFLVAAAVMPASAADGSMFLPAGTPVLIDGTAGPQIGIIRDAADGKASLTRCKAV